MHRLLMALLLTVPTLCFGQLRVLGLGEAIEIALADNLTVIRASLTAQAATD